MHWFTSLDYILPDNFRYPVGYYYLRIRLLRFPTNLFANFRGLVACRAFMGVLIALVYFSRLRHPALQFPGSSRLLSSNPTYSMDMPRLPFLRSSPCRAVMGVLTALVQSCLSNPWDYALLPLLQALQIFVPTPGIQICQVPSLMDYSFAYF